MLLQELRMVKTNGQSLGRLECLRMLHAHAWLCPKDPPDFVHLWLLGDLFIAAQMLPGSLRKQGTGQCLSLLPSHHLPWQRQVTDQQEFVMLAGSSNT